MTLSKQDELFGSNVNESCNVSADWSGIDEYWLVSGELLIYGWTKTFPTSQIAISKLE